MATFMKEYDHLKIQLKAIKLATNDFNEKNVIGYGGFGKVYVGEICHSHSERKGLVALKRLDRKHGQGDPQFWKEIMMLSRYRHENLISLLGYCIEEGEMILIYEHASRGSLERYLSDVTLTWRQRIKICLDAAKGLSFLHDPNERQQRVLHCDIKCANILLDDNLNAKVSDFGLSKIGSTSQQYSVIITNAVGTPGYCDPLYMETYQLTKESDVYSFGVVLFEVLCGRQCVEFCNGQTKVYVPSWKKAYEDKELLEGIVLEDLKKQMAPTSLETFTDIAYQCLQILREERPTMSLVVKSLEKALEEQEKWKIPKKYAEIANASAERLIYRSLEELKELLYKGVLLNDGKMLSLNNKEEKCVIISIEDCLSQDDPVRNYSSGYSFKKKSRFPVGCYRTRRSFKIRVPCPLLISPNIKYGLNLVFQYGKRERINQQYVPVRYTLQGEKKISLVYFADMRKDGWLVAELYQFTSDSDKSIRDLEIIFEFCQLSDFLYIEGIEFQPLERVEHPVVEYDEILKAAATPLYYRSTKELKVLLFRGVLLNGGKMWFSINDKEQHCLMLSIEDCLIRDDPNRDYSDEYLSENISRFVAGYYKTHIMKFKIRFTTPLFLSPHVTYGVNLVFQYSNIKMMEQKSFPVMYKLLGETKISMVNIADMREDGWLVAKLYHFTNEGDKSILDLEIIFEDCGRGLSGYFYIEGIEFQPLGRVEHPVVEYDEILKAAATPLYYRSTKELKLYLKQYLTERVQLNGGKTLFCLNGKGEHIETIFIETCLNPDQAGSVKHYDRVNSRFPGGRCYEYEDEFKACVRAKYLSSHISYTVNLVFRYRWQSDVNKYNPLRYKIDGEDETKVFIIYPIDMRQDGWFIAPLYQFTSQHSTTDLQFEFERRHSVRNLIVAGIEFQPSVEKVELQVFEEYQHIVKAASQSLFYTSLKELKQILSKGVHLNGYKMWFSINEKGEHCHMISMKDCLIPNEDSTPQYESHYMSRFPAGLYQTNSKGFKTHVKTHLLSPSIAYTVNLKYNGYSIGEQVYVDLKYRLRGETTSTVYLANKRDDDYMSVAELYQFTSDGSIVDLEIEFDDHGTNLEAECIVFLPLEIVEDQVSKKDKVEIIQTVSDSESDTYWEKKLPNDYEEILKLSKDSLQWKVKKELYSVLRRGFLIDNGQQWFAFDKHGKKCLMLSARATWIIIDDKNLACESSQESRFGEVLLLTTCDKFAIDVEINSDVVSPKTTYACYLVYKLPLDQSTFEAPMEAVEEMVPGYQFIYLVSPPHTPVIGPNFNKNTRYPMNRYKRNAIPQQRSDGWMEVQVRKFQTTTEPISMHLQLKHPGKKDLSGLMIEGIELRPV